MLIPLAEATPPAGGAATSEILIAAGIAAPIILAFGWITLRERTGKTTWAGRLADAMATASGLPRWVALPAVFLVLSLITAAFGVWWDVPIHMQNGRDPGPLANPSHYPIFLGILGFLHAGILSMALARDPLPRRTFRLSPTWRVPMGSMVALGAGTIAAAGFPADDLWHRLFGQDVTEWGPTHVMMIGGAVTCILAVPLWLAEAAQVGAPATQGLRGRVTMALALGLCVIPVGFLMEFDLGVPQFPAVTQFIIAGFLATWIFAGVRLWFGPGGALLAGGLYLFIHGLIYVMVLPLPDVLSARFLLLLPSAVLVELVAAAISPARKPVPFGVVAGLAVGTVGMYAEWLWTKAFMPIPQPVAASSLPLMLTAGTVAAIGGGLVATWHVARVREVAAPQPVAVVSAWQRRGVGLVGLSLFLGLMAIFAPPRAGDESISGVLGLDQDCDGGSKCLARVSVQLEPADALDDAIWFYALAWQGRPKGASGDIPSDPAAGVPGILRVEMKATGTPGEFRSAQAVPLYGNWKTMLRLHLAPTTMLVFPLYAPDDPAIKGDQGRQVLAKDGDHVDAVLERKFLQRETRDDVPGWLFAVGYSLVIASWIVLLFFFGRCYNAAGSATAPALRKETVST